MFWFVLILFGLFAFAFIARPMRWGRPMGGWRAPMWRPMAPGWRMRRW